VLGARLKRSENVLVHKKAKGRGSKVAVCRGGEDLRGKSFIAILEKLSMEGGRAVTTCKKGVRVEVVSKLHILGIRDRGALGYGTKLDT